MNLRVYFILDFFVWLILLELRRLDYIGVEIFILALLIYYAYRNHLEVKKLRQKGIDVSFWKMLNPIFRIKNINKLYFE